MRETISILWRMATGELKKEELKRDIELEYRKSQILTLPQSIRNYHKLEYLQLNSRYMAKYGFYHKIKEDGKTKTN